MYVLLVMNWKNSRLLVILNKKEIEIQLMIYL